MQYILQADKIVPETNQELEGKSEFPLCCLSQQ